MVENRFGQLLNTYLQEVDQSASWLARKLDVSRSTVGRWLNGEALPQSPEKVAEIAKVLKLKEEVRQTFFAAAGFAYIESNTADVNDRSETSAFLSNQTESPPQAIVDTEKVAPVQLGQLSLRRVLLLLGLDRTSSPSNVLKITFGLGIVMVVVASLLWLPRFLPHPTPSLPTPQTPTASPSSASVPATSQTNPPPSATATAYTPTICGELQRRKGIDANRFLRIQGVSNFTVENTDSGVLDNVVRSLVINQTGLWIGYFAPPHGVGNYDGWSWADCSTGLNFAVERVNALLTDRLDHVWAGMERNGIAMFDGSQWQHYTTANGLPSDGIFGLTLDREGKVWAATWEGIARFDGDRWSTPYSVYNHTLVNNHTHAIEFDQAGNIWVGTVDHGVSRYSSQTGKWIHYDHSNSGLGGDAIRKIIVRPATETDPESIWFATADGGVSRFMQENWQVFTTSEGIPSEKVSDVALDRYGRVWTATERGVAFWDENSWQTYITLNSQAIAIGPACLFCRFGEDHIWVATNGDGLTHSRLPLPDPVIDVLEVKVTHDVAPGEKFRPEITIVTRAPYRLRIGDFLAHVDPSDEQRFGAWPHIAVTKLVEPGEPYTFSDYDNPFTAPNLTGDQPQIYTSTWRLWMDTRYVGPTIPITFTVHPASNPASLP